MSRLDIPEPVPDEFWAWLSPRQADYLRARRQGLSFGAIARQLGVSDRAIYNFATAVRRKWLERSAALAALAAAKQDNQEVPR